MNDSTELKSGPRKGVVAAPPSKSHAHRLAIADFLAGDTARFADSPDDSDDLRATKRCLRALGESVGVRRRDGTGPVLDVGESGSTLRFLMPVAAALGVRPTYRTAGRLASRPVIEYPELKPGSHALAGDVSSQFVTGLLFALPLLDGDSQIRFTSPLESRGYVDMTLEVLKGAGIVVRETRDGFDIPGGQRYRAQPQVAAEGDWSGAAFWLAMNALGSAVEVTGLDADSVQPDRKIVQILSAWESSIDVSGCPDLFPVLTIVAAQQDGATRFTGTRRLRLKESNRVAAMAEAIARLGRRVGIEDNTFTVHGAAGPFPGGVHLPSFGDHRIAMSVAVAATCAEGSLHLDDIRCGDKSYPNFFEWFERLRQA